MDRADSLISVRLRRGKVSAKAYRVTGSGIEEGALDPDELLGRENAGEIERAWGRNRAAAAAMLLQRARLSLPPGTRIIATVVTGEEIRLFLRSGGGAAPGQPGERAGQSNV